MQLDAFVAKILAKCELVSNSSHPRAVLLQTAFGTNKLYFQVWMQPNGLLSVFTRGKKIPSGLKCCVLRYIYAWILPADWQTEENKSFQWFSPAAQLVPVLVNTRSLNCIDEAAGWSSVRQEHETPKCYRAVGHRKRRNGAALDGVMQPTFPLRALGLRADTGYGEWSQTSHSLLVGLLSGWKLACVFSPVP